MKARICLCLAVMVSTISLASACRADGPYHYLKTIQIGGKGGWDYLSVDDAARRLYVSHATRIVIIDLDQDALAGEIGDTMGVHGFAIAPDLRRGFSSNGKEDTASVVDLNKLITLSKVNTGPNPDAIVYEPGRQEVYTFNGRGQSATVFDAKSGGIVTNVPLPGKPEFAVADPAAGRIFDNIEDKSVLVSIDTSTHQVANTWPIAPGEEASGLAIDPAHHRLFAGCHNKLMVMMDSATGKVITSVPIGAGVDACAFDPATGFAFSSCGDGTVTVAHEDSPDKLTVVQTLATEKGARTMALDPKTHRLYLATAKFEPPDPNHPDKRPRIIPDTFKILVYGM